jgi:hypothetical protein
MLWLVRQGLGALIDESSRQRAIGELGNLNDHLLMDIGLRRDQLPTFDLKSAVEKRNSLQSKASAVDFFGANRKSAVQTGRPEKS